MSKTIQLTEYRQRILRLKANAAGDEQHKQDQENELHHRSNNGFDSSTQCGKRKRSPISDTDSGEFTPTPSKHAKVERSFNGSSSSIPYLLAPNTPLKPLDQNIILDLQPSCSHHNGMPVKEPAIEFTPTPSKHADGSIATSAPVIPNLLAPNTHLQPLDPNIILDLQPSCSHHNGMPVKNPATEFTPMPSKHGGGSIATSAPVVPNLLAPNTPLKPLDPNIILDLQPSCSHYNSVSDIGADSDSSASTVSDEEICNRATTSKTKIYSGVRLARSAPTLATMCTRYIQKNISNLKFNGGEGLYLLMEILEKITPQQLSVFEENNQHLMVEIDILWQQHVSRRFRNKQRLENESWREMYTRCGIEEERKLVALNKIIKDSRDSIVVNTTKVTYKDSMVKPPPDALKKQKKLSTNSQLVATPAARVPSLYAAIPNAAKAGDQRLKVFTTPTPRATPSSSAANTNAAKTGDQRLKVPTPNGATVAKKTSKPKKKAPLMQKVLKQIRSRFN